MKLNSRFHPQFWLGPLLLAVLAGTLIGVAVDPGGDLPNWPSGPGVTLDESFNVQQGVYLKRGIATYGWGALDPASLQEIYNTENGYLPDHPPLGRLWLGVAHDFAVDVLPTETVERTGWSLLHARFGSAVAFALTVLLIGWVAAYLYNPATGFFSSLALVMMPRVVGHAHLASLETVTNLFYTIAVLSVAACWTKSQPPTRKVAIFCGVLWGLAMLTKIQGLLIMVPVGIWGLCYWRQRSVIPGALFGVAGFVTLFICWPWLWSAPLDHLQEYLGRTTDRSINKVFYLSKTYIDHADASIPELAEYPVVPWHYPLLMFAVTVPLGFQFLGLLGLKVKPLGRMFDAPLQVILACAFFPVALFCLPSVSVYDGVRLFLTVYPLWAIVIGRGGAVAWAWLSERAGLFGIIVWLTAFLGAQLTSMFVLHPCLLSYYNLGVLSLRGADDLGFEPTYWGDSLHREFQEEVVKSVPKGTQIGLVPVLHQYQLLSLASQSKVFHDHQIEIVPFDPNMPDPPDYVMTFYRKADHSAELTQRLEEAEIVVEYRRQVVLLSALFKLDSSVALDSR